MRTRLLKLALFAAASAVAVFAQSANAHLDFAGNLQMLACDPVSSAPCFRMQLNVVDAQGHPAGVELPENAKLPASMRVHLENEELTPFYAAAEHGSSAPQHRVALVLIDISGSMNRKLSTGNTRFEAARSALEDFLNQFQNGYDEVAIVPFESHHVIDTIRNARFVTTRQDALAAATALPLPGPRNDTALYSAVSAGLDTLSQQAKSEAAQSGKPPDTLLIVMTDGTNEILRGDDPGLLAGPAGLEQVSSKVRQSGMQVIGIGFGDPSEIDQTALKALSTKSFMASGYDELRRIFALAHKLLTDRLTATFVSPWPDRASLAGRTLHVTADLTLPSGQVLTSTPQVWSAPAIGLPLYEGRCSAAEMKALLDETSGTTGGWISVVRPLVVFGGLAALLLILWFWVPRLVWPEQYIGEVPAARWLGSSGSRAQRPGRDPTGFGPQSKQIEGLNRAPSEGTIVQPDFTRTRLERYGKE